MNKLLPEDENKIHSPERCVLNKIQDMVKVQKLNNLREHRPIKYI
jgi:hypothetical protein